MSRDAGNAPTPYTVVTLPEALRQWQRLPKPVQQHVTKRIQLLSQNPRPQQAKPLKGLKGLWRLRVGNYRILYQIDDAARKVLILDMGNRKDIYRGL